MPEQPRIFVSHDHRDADWCRAFVKMVRKRGADVWYDRDSRNANRFRAQIEKELRARPIFVVIYSPESLESHWVNREIDAALSLHDKNPDHYRIIQVIAVTCSPPHLLSGYDNVCGSSEEGLDPKEAAKRVAEHLGLPPRGQMDRPVLVTTRSAKSYWRLGQAFSRQGRFEDALAAIEGAIRLKPQKAQYWLDKGNVLLRLNRPEEAKEAFDRAKRLD